MGTPAAPQYRLERRRFGVLGILWMANFVFWMSWFMQGPLLAAYWGAHQRVSFGNAEYLLSGVDIASIFTALLFGHFYDRFGPKRATTLCQTIILIGFGLRPLAVNSFPWMLVLTIIAGLGLPIIAAPPPVISQWFGVHRMTLPLLVTLSSFVCGQAAGLLLGARMVEQLGARWAFGVMTIAIAVFLAAWLLAVPRAPSSPAGPTPAHPAPVLTALRTIVRAPQSWIAFSIGGVYAAVIVFSGSFLPGVLAATLHLSPADGGEAAAVVPGAAFFGMFVFAYLVHRSKRPLSFGRLTSALQLLAWAAFTVLWFTDHLALAAALALLAVFGFSYQACFGLGLHRIEHSAEIRADTVGVAAGFYFTGVSIGGYILPTALAHIVNATSTKAGFIGLGILFLAGTALWLVSRERNTATQQPLNLDSTSALRETTS
jgi:MFS family permease